MDDREIEASLGDAIRTMTPEQKAEAIRLVLGPREVADRRRAAEALREGMAFARATTASVADGMISRSREAGPASHPIWAEVEALEKALTALGIAAEEVREAAAPFAVPDSEAGAELKGSSPRPMGSPLVDRLRAATTTALDIRSHLNTLAQRLGGEPRTGPRRDNAAGPQ
jgi:hypothetical protein